MEGRDAISAIVGHWGSPASLVPEPAPQPARAHAESSQPRDRHSAQNEWSDAEAARRIVDRLSNDGRPYDEWLAVGMALHSVGLPVDVWDAWSRNSTKKYRERECHEKWGTFTAGGGVGMGTLITMARQDGYEPYPKGQNGNGHARIHCGGPIDSEADDEPRDDGPYVANDQHAEPIPLDLIMVPRLPNDIFDGWLGEHMDALACSTETPRELAAMFSLAALGTVCQKRFSMRLESNYFEPMNIWTLTALESGNRKTAVYRATTEPLIRFEQEQAAGLATEIKSLESKRRSAEARIAYLRGQAKKKDEPTEREELEREIIRLEDGLPQIPRVPRLFTQDVTPEHIGTMLSENDERLAILSDEGGIFDIIGGRYSNGVPNLDVFLQSHAGSSVRVDRGSRPPVILNHPALTIGLSPQPDVLRGLVKHRSFRGRGLLARFLYTVPSSRVGYRDLTPREMPEAVSGHYQTQIFSLASIPPNLDGGRELPRVLMLRSDAYTIWKGFQREVETLMREGQKLEHLKDWGGKLPGAVGRIAGLLHCAAYTSQILEHHYIDAETMDRALRLGGFLVEHAGCIRHDGRR